MGEGWDDSRYDELRIGQESLSALHYHSTGIGKSTGPRLRECSRQFEAEVVSNSSNNNSLEFDNILISQLHTMNHPNPKGQSYFNCRVVSGQL